MNQDISERVVKVFCFEYEINSRLYGGHIPALSWEDAQERVSKFGAKVYGEVVETQCARCGQVDKEKPEFSPYDFPDVIE